MSRQRRIAFDSSCFTAFLGRGENHPQDALEAVRQTIEQMTRGTVRIVASAVIEVEVTGDRLDGEGAEAMRRFHSYLRAEPGMTIYPESSAVLTKARRLQEAFVASGRRGGYADLVHLATAILARADEFWTFDARLLRAADAGAISEITVCRPYLNQGVLSFDP